MPLPSAVSSAVVALAKASPRALPAYAYGTSGFRGLATTLDSVCLRMGMLATLRSWAISQERAANGVHVPAAAASSAAAPACPIIGLMVTASHNGPQDNGVKLVDATGEMMAYEWEGVATELANAKEEAVAEAIEKIMARFGMDALGAASLTGSGPKGRVFVARDTRVSSPHLCNLVIAGARALGAEVTDFDLATTPQLHWMVREANSGRVATMDAYYKQLARAFRTSLECKSAAAAHSSSGGAALLSPLIVDCANGVGALSVSTLAPLIKDLLPMELRNTVTAQGLNEDCGAEHVQKGRMLPRNFSLEGDKGKKLAALDGDADRLVLFHVTDKGFRLLDGDKIIALYTLFIRDLLTKAGLDSLTLGIVQTAYANGASTLFMQRSLGIDVQFTNTGVKHLHHRAIHYDIGVYFESNGHGTVVFSEKAQKGIREAAAKVGSEDGEKQRGQLAHAQSSPFSRCSVMSKELILIAFGIHRCLSFHSHTMPLRSPGSD
jgi:phosphoacetylglucosamine mutase